jgi:hypothetical protein
MTEGNGQYEPGIWNGENEITAEYNDGSEQYNKYASGRTDMFFPKLQELGYNPHGSDEDKKAAFNYSKSVFNRAKSYAAAYAAYIANKALWDAYKANQAAWARYNAWQADNGESEWAVYRPLKQAYDEAVAAHDTWVEGAKKWLTYIPKNAYFLGRKGTALPKYYREVAADPEEGYLLVQPKPVTLTVAPISMNAGDDVDKLNEFAPAYVADYSDKVFDGDELAFTFAFNTDDTANPAVNSGLLNNDGELKTAADYTAGNYAYWDADTKTLSEVVKLVPGDNSNYDVAVVFADIILVGANDLVLNQSDPNLNSKIKDAADDNDPVRAISFSSRELKAGYWYTMVLPFDVKTADLVSALRALNEGSTTEYHPVYAIVNRFSTASTKKHISFTLEMNEIPANEPFMIKTSETVDLANAKFGNITISYSANPATEAGTDGDQFIGTYTEKSIIMTDGINYGWYDSEDQKRWRQPENAAHVMKPMEAYLKYAEGTFHAPVITFEDLNENGTTSIVTFNADTKSFVAVDGWYTLNGVKLQGAPTEKGIYINNGKKIVIK